MLQIETWVLYDKDRKELGKVVPRNFSTNKNEFHLSVHVWIKSGNKYLVFRRSKNKVTYPNMIEPIGGGVNGYDSTFETAIRETEEESGIKVQKDDLFFQFTVTNKDCRFVEHCDVFIFNKNITLNDVRIEEGQNANPQLITKDEILKLIKTKEMIPLVSYKKVIIDKF